MRLYHGYVYIIQSQYIQNNSTVHRAYRLMMMHYTIIAMITDMLQIQYISAKSVQMLLF